MSSRMRRPLRDFTVGERLLTWGTCVIVQSDKLEVVPTENIGRTLFHAVLYYLSTVPFAQQCRCRYISNRLFFCSGHL
jgi:hypothetical protein